MSTHRRERFACPYCSKGQEVTLWESVNVELDPSISQQLLDGSLLDHTCANCGRSTVLRYPLLYHDPTLKLMAWLLPPGTEASDEALRLPDVPTIDAYRFRVVKSVDELVEGTTARGRAG